jgi:hypothetical protein
MSTQEETKDVFKIQRLERAEQWPTWHIRFMGYCDVKGCLQALLQSTAQGATPEGTEVPENAAAQAAANEAFDKQNRQARGLLLQAIGDDHIQELAGLKSAHEIWERLERRFVTAGADNSAIHRTRLHSTKLKPGEDMEGHLNKLDRHKLAYVSTGGQVPDEEYIRIIFDSLPREYSTIRTALSVLPKGQLTVNKVRQDLIAEYLNAQLQFEANAAVRQQNLAFAAEARQHQGDQGGRARERAGGRRGGDRQGRKGSSSGFCGVCFVCGETGHRAHQCEHRKGAKQDERRGGGDRRPSGGTDAQKPAPSPPAAAAPAAHGAQPRQPVAAAARAFATVVTLAQRPERVLRPDPVPLPSDKDWLKKLPPARDFFEEDEIEEHLYHIQPPLACAAETRNMVSHALRASVVGAHKKTRKNQLYLDSAATEHMVNRAELLTNLVPVKGKEVLVANGEYLPVVAKGTLILQTRPDFIAEVHDVLLVPGLHCNLFSVRRISSRGYDLCFRQDLCEIVGPETTSERPYLARARISTDNQLYEVEGKIRTHGDPVAMALAARSSFVPKFL